MKKCIGRELKLQDITVDVTIRRIRKYFESIVDTPEIITTIHSDDNRFYGYIEK